jgi:hypothetical protein
MRGKQLFLCLRCHVLNTQMDRQIFVFLIVVAELLSCKKSSNWTAGQIVGWNNGYCATCGGFYVNLSSDTTINTNTLYAINYANNLQGIVNQFYAEYNKNHMPIPVSFSSQPIPNQKNWIRVTGILNRY